MPVSNQLKNQHLLWRAGFGPILEEFNQIGNATPQSYSKALFRASAATPKYIDVADNAIKGLAMGIDEVARQQRQQLSDDQKKLLREKSKENIKSLNLAWLDEMVNSNQQLREKMALFWHGHFASRNLNILYQQQLLGIIRKNALGNFSDLLREVSKSAAIINFLNNNQNRKGHPNENFAREVMELFTLGRGHYSENDIKEAARAFTGWGASLSGEFVFRKFQHDEGSKTIFGKTGFYDGDDVLDMLVENPQTAVFLCRKLYRFFVNEEVNEEKVAWLAARFYQGNYNISSLMQDIFNNDWFYDPVNIGARIKSPIELIAGIRRMLPMKMENPEIQLLLQRLLGQMLFYPPNVAGWPGGTNWIDSSSLMLRLRIPRVIYTSDELNLQPKTDDDQQMGRMESGNRGAGRMGGFQARVEIDWVPFLKNYKDVRREDLPNVLASRLLQVPAGINTSLLNAHVDAGSRESFIKTATILYMSTPEYQMC